MGAHRCAVVLVVGVMLGVVLGGCGPENLDLEDPRVESVADLEGTWSGSDLVGPVTVTFTGCAVGEECGRLENRGCVYALVYRSEDVDGFNFETDSGNGLQCNGSLWANGVMHVTPGEGDSVWILMLPMGSAEGLTLLFLVED